ncbi:hypothetical protein [Spiroplasma poulsonii]|nr:hypothetical protein [Spiroplasma poulsonii]
MGPPSRREIGHGALGEKALLQDYSEWKGCFHIQFALFQKY